MRFDVVNALVLLVGLLSSGAPFSGGGCGLNAYDGRSGDRLHFSTVQGDRTRFVWQLGVRTGYASTIPARTLNQLPAAGPRSWKVVRSAIDAKQVYVSERLPDGSNVDLPALHLERQPLSFSGIADREGSPWLFFKTFVPDGETFVTAYRRERDAWRKQGEIVGELHVPRLDPSGGGIWIGSRRFAGGGRVVAWPEDRLPPRTDVFDFFSWYPVGRTMIVMSSRRGWMTADGGKRWEALPLPQGVTATSLMSPVQGSERLVISWTDSTKRYVDEWRSGRWKRLASLERRRYDTAGPVIQIDDHVVFLGLCYKTLDGRAWTTATIVQRGAIESFDIEMISD